MRRVLALALLLAVPALGDEIVLEGGGRISCEVLEETPSHVRIRLPRGTMLIPRDRVVHVERERRALYLTREARRFLSAGSTEAAVEMFERAYADDPGEKAGLAKALFRHAEALVRQHRHEKAQEALARLRQLQPSHAGAGLLEGRIEREEAETDAIRDRYETALEDGDLRAALRLLDDWRVRRPPGDPTAAREMAALHVRLGRQAHEATALREALDHYRAAAAYGARGPELDEALRALRPIAVLESLKEGDVDAARRQLESIATTYPDPAVPAFLEGVIHHVTGDVQESLRWYAEAARAAEKGAPAGTAGYELVRKYATATLRAAVARPPQEGVARWRGLFLGPLACHDGGLHVVVYAPTLAQARAVAEAADERYAAIARELLGRVPDTARAEIVIHPDRRAYLAADPSPPGTPIGGATLDRSATAGCCYDTLDERGAPLVRIEAYASDRLLQDTLPHELVHVVQRRGLPAYRRGHWLDEGLAMLFESQEARTARLALWNRVREARIPLPELLALKSTPPGRETLFYTEAHAFASFLRSLGDDRAWRTFLDACGTGTVEEAARRAFGVESIAVLERMWLQ